MTKRRSNGDGSLTYRKNTRRWEGRYAIYDELGVKHVKTVSARTKAEAAEKLRQGIVAAKGKVHNLQKSETLEAYHQYWNVMMKKKCKLCPNDPTNYKLHTIETYSRAMEKVILPRLGKMKISKITKRDIRLAIQDANNKTGKTRQCQIGRDAISAVMKLAIEEEKITDNPALGVPLPKYITEEKEIWSADELGQFLQSIRVNRFYLLFLLIAECGLRRGEALGLRKQDCDLKNNIIMVRQQVISLDNRPVITSPKTQASIRDIPISDSLAKLLREHIAKDASACDLLHHTSNNTPISPRNIQRAYKQAVKQAKVRYLSLHSMRHSFCTDLCYSGVDMKTNQVLMGHSDPTVTMKVYQHVSQQHKVEASEKLKHFRMSRLGIAY